MTVQEQVEESDEKEQVYNKLKKELGIVAYSVIGRTNMPIQNQWRAKGASKHTVGPNDLCTLLYRTKTKKKE